MKISNFKFQISNRQGGQILLITIMLVATILTIVLAVTFKSTTETQLTKLEEDSQKALAAAEAGVEAALQRNLNDTVSIASLPNMTSSGISGDATVNEVRNALFVSPLLQQDQQYTFYLSDYPTYANPILNGNIRINFMTEGACPSLELTFISVTPQSVKRNIVDPCGNIANADILTTAGSALGGYNFVHRSDILPINNQAVLIIRSLFASTRIGLERTDAGQTLPVQGKYITSEAKTKSGVSKKVQLFQSYPQIPAEFFVTSF